MRKGLFITALITFILVSSAHGDYFEGNDLMKLKQSREIHDETMYRGYVAGVQDAFNGYYFSIPPDVRMSQAAEIVYQYIKGKPKRWHEPAKVLIIDALKESFPIRK